MNVKIKFVLIFLFYIQLKVAANPEVTINSWESHSNGKFIEAEVSNVEVGSILIVETTKDLAVRKWTRANAASQIVEKVPAKIAFFVNDNIKREFFRVVSISPKVTMKGQVLIVTEAASLDQVIATLNRSSARQFSIQNPYSYENIQDPSNPATTLVAPGQYRISNANDLSKIITRSGIGIWETPPVKDNKEFADRYFPPTTASQHLVDIPTDLPGETGNGDFEKGWRGDQIKIVPKQGSPINPGQFDKPFNNLKDPGLGPKPLDQIELPSNNNIGYVRVEWQFVRDLKGNKIGSLVPSVIKPKRVFEVKGDKGFLSNYPPMPGDDQYIAAIVGPRGNIIQITTFVDPLIRRAYPEKKEHGHHKNESSNQGFAIVSVPLINGSVMRDLDNLKIQIYALKERFRGKENILTPEVLTKNRDIFVPVASIQSKEMVNLLSRQPSEQELRRLIQSAGKNVEIPNARALGITKFPTVTNLLKSGSNGSKLNITIIGDGFDDSDSDQQLFNDYVENEIMQNLRTKDIHPEILNGINVVKINTFSKDSGVTQVDSNGNITTARETALDTEYSGVWSRCWMENGPEFSDMLDAHHILFAPQTDITIIVLNETGFGGCARNGNKFYCTLAPDPWPVIAHEFGHAPGGLGDEYTTSSSSNYTGSEPSKPNLTANTNRDTLKWKQWVPSWRSLPTASSQISDGTDDVGLFAGGIQWDSESSSNQSYNSGLFHPSDEGRMNNNDPPHSPVGYGFIKDAMRTYQEATFQKNVTGDFNGDGRADFVLLDGRQISLYLGAERNVGPDDPQTGSPPRSVTAVLEPTWFNTDYIYNSSGGWFRTRPGDKYFVGDFDGDGKDDIYVVNFTNWSKPWLIMLKSFGDHFEHVNAYKNILPGWDEMRSGDDFYVCDFNNDGKDDLCIYNGSNWRIPYFGMLRSNGTSLTMVRRYDQFLPGWEMGKNEKFHVGDFNGDGRGDFVAHDKNHWAYPHLRIYTSTGNALSLRDRYYGLIERGSIKWPMRRRDNIHVLDFNGDGITDISTFNGRDWSDVYLGLWIVNSKSSRMTGIRLYDTKESTDTTDVPGWTMTRRDTHYVADVNGDGKDDIVVYNKDNWSTEYLAILQSNGVNSLQGSWQSNWIGSWNLGNSDKFHVADFRGTSGWDDLIVYNNDWLGLLRSYSNVFVQETMYRKWIHNHRYHASGWW